MQQEATLPIDSSQKEGGVTLCVHSTAVRRLVVKERSAYSLFIYDEHLPPILTSSRLARIGGTHRLLMAFFPAKEFSMAADGYWRGCFVEVCFV